MNRVHNQAILSLPWNDVDFSDNIIYTTGSGTFGDRNFSSSEATNIDPLLELSDCLVPDDNCESELANAIYKIGSLSSPAVDPTPTHTITDATSDSEYDDDNGRRRSHRRNRPKKTVTFHPVV